MSDQAPDHFQQVARRAGAAARTTTEELVVTTAALHAHRRRQTARRTVAAGVLAVAAAATATALLARPDTASMQPVAPPSEPAPTSQLVRPAPLDALGVSLTLPPGWEVVSDDARTSVYELASDQGAVARATVLVPGRDVDLAAVPGVVEVERTSTQSSVGPVGLVFYEVEQRQESPLCVGAAGEPCGVPDVEPGHRYVAAYLGEGDGQWVVHGEQGETTYSFYNAIPGLVQGFSDD